jgi:SnoaL-like domain
MDSPKPVRDETAWRLSAAYIEAWNKRDRDAWLDLFHPELEFHPTALVGTDVVYRGIDGAARYLDGLIAGGRAERAEIAGLRRLAADRFLIELELNIDGKPVMTACVLAQLRDGKFVYTAGYLSDVPTLASIGVIPKDAPAIPQLAAEPPG